MEALRHAQAKCSELEKINKKFQEHALAGRKEIARLKEELQVFKSKVSSKYNGKQLLRKLLFVYYSGFNEDAFCPKFLSRLSWKNVCCCDTSIVCWVCLVSGSSLERN